MSTRFVCKPEVQALDPRVLFAFGDLDTSWDGDGVLRLNQYGGSDALNGLALQSNGQLVIALRSDHPGNAEDVQTIIKRRTASGGLDSTFGSNGQRIVTIFPEDYISGLEVLRDDSIVSIKGFNGPESYSNSVVRLTKGGQTTSSPGLNDPQYTFSYGAGGNGNLYLHGADNYPATSEEDPEKYVISVYDPVAGKTTKVDSIPGSIYPQSDGTVILLTDNKLYHLSADLKTQLKFGSANYATLPSTVQDPYLDVIDIATQGGNLIVAANTNGSEHLTAAIFRINGQTGAVDTNFAKNSPQASGGIVNIPLPTKSMKLLDDGSILYAAVGGTGAARKIAVGHLTPDGQRDAAQNTDYGGFARGYDIGGAAEPSKIVVGKNGQVYVGGNYRTSDMSYGYDGDFIDGLVLKLKMQPQANAAGKITGILYNDNNKNNIKEASETLNVARTVFIDTNGNGKLDSGERSTLTDSSGRYTFDGLVAGVYKVRRVLPAGYAVTSSLFSTGAITLAAGTTVVANIGSTYA